MFTCSYYKLAQFLLWFAITRLCFEFQKTLEVTFCTFPPERVLFCSFPFCSTFLSIVGNLVCSASFTCVIMAFIHAIVFLWWVISLSRPSSRGEQIYQGRDSNPTVRRSNNFNRTSTRFSFSVLNRNDVNGLLETSIEVNISCIYVAL